MRCELTVFWRETDSDYAGSHVASARCHNHHPGHELFDLFDDSTCGCCSVLGYITITDHQPTLF